MKSVSGKIVSCNLTTLSKASRILSDFISLENGASQPVSVYLRRASAAFSELTQFHKELNRSRTKRRSNSAQTEEIPAEKRLEHVEIDGDALRKRDKKNKKKKKIIEGVETESGGNLGIELEENSKVKKKRKSKEIDDDDQSLDSEKKKKKKRRRIEGVGEGGGYNGTPFNADYLERREL